MRRARWMRGADRASPRAEHGFTVVEMITAVVIMGVIIAPLTAALSQSMKLLPEAGARSESALQESKFVEKFAQDVSEITEAPSNFLTFSGFFGTGPLLCGAAPGFLDLQYLLFAGTKTRNTPPALNAIYAAEFDPAVSGIQKMRVQRWVTGPGNVMVEPPKTVLAGYCVPGEPVAYVSNTNADTGSRRYILTVLLRPQVGMAAETITAEAAVRSTNIG